MSEKPVFEISTPDGGRVIAIYANGLVSGMEHAPGLSVIINHIPQLIANAVQEVLKDPLVDDIIRSGTDDGIEVCARLIELESGRGYKAVAADLRKLKSGKSILETGT